MSAQNRGHLKLVSALGKVSRKNSITAVARITEQIYNFIMLSITFFSALLATGLAETISIDVGRVPLTFTPEVVHAEIGDILEFRFYPQAHSVVLGDFDKPCAPVDHGGFFSGLVPVPVGSISDQVFKVTVNHTDPMFIYCSQGNGNHCPRGMVAAINPSGNKTLSAYAQNAIGRAIFSPFPDEAFGGVFGAPSLVGEPRDGAGGDNKGDGTCPPESKPSGNAPSGGEGAGTGAGTGPQAEGAEEEEDSGVSHTIRQCSLTAAAAVFFVALFLA